MQHRLVSRRSWRRWVYRGMVAIGALVVLTFLAISWWIGSDVYAISDVAVREYGGDEISALIKYVDSSSHSLQKRNEAVWALGHLGDPRALPVLEKHYTDKPCDHHDMLCQRELEKAIDLCRGGVNLPSLVWRHGFLRGIV